MQPRKFRTIVFDLDGTLVDSYRDIAAALNAVLRSLGRPEHAPEEIKTMIGQGVGVLLERGLAGDRDPRLVELARARFKDEYIARVVETTRPYDGVMEAIAELARRGAITAIATNKPAMFTRPIVDALGFDRAGIAAVASADEAGARKPNPRVVELAIARAGAALDRASTIYVGDMPVDRETAQAFGCALAGVGWGFDPNGLALLGADVWLEQPGELVSLAE